MDRHVVLIGLNYQLRRSTGDKTFWFHLMPLLAEELDRITIISIRKHETSFETEKIHNCQIDIHYLPPVFLETPDAIYSRPRIFWRKGAFPRWWSIIEKVLNTRRLIGKLRDIYACEPFIHVHLMDNFGLANRKIVSAAKSLHSTFSISAVAYQGKSSVIYHPYLKLSYNHSDIFTVSYSATQEKKLIEIGLDPDRIIHIPWGVLPSDNRITPGEKNLIKSRLNLPAGKPLFLWVGYIQQIKRSDFLFALQNAKAALRQELDAVFFFSFKPESMEKGFERYHRPFEGIYVESTTPTKFESLKLASDVFYSPVTNRDCIVTPPLTWIEMMALGVPILTTDVPGTDEIVEKGKTGYISTNEEQDLIEHMFIISDKYSAMQEACVKKVEGSYNIHIVAKKYLDFWRHLRSFNNDL